MKKNPKTIRPLWEEIGSHRLNGKPPAYGQRTRLTIIALQNFPHKRYREIAEQVGFDVGRVSSIAWKLIQAGKLSPRRANGGLGLKVPPRSPLPPPQRHIQAATTTERPLTAAEHNARWANGVIGSLVKKGHLDIIKIDGRNWYRLRGEEAAR
jgi:hypothetical protein